MLNENINVANSNQINKLFISKYDDFGKKIDNKCIIKDGQIVNLISAHCTNDLEYSLKNKSLLIRQKLISLKPPKTYEEDIIKKIDNGVYLKTPTYGTLDKYGNVIIGFNAGYQIVDGEIRNMIRPGFVKKQLIDILKSIKYVGHNTVLDSGICIKKKEKKILLTEGVDLICKVDLLKGINNE